MNMQLLEVVSSQFKWAWRRIKCLLVIGVQERAELKLSLDGARVPVIGEVVALVVADGGGVLVVVWVAAPHLSRRGFGELLADSGLRGRS